MGKIIMYMNAEQIKQFEDAIIRTAPKDLPKLAQPKQAISNAFKMPLPTDTNELFDKWFKANPQVVESKMIYNPQTRGYSVLKKP